MEWLTLSRWASLVAQTVKNLPAVQETQVQGREGPLEKGMAIHSRILAWRILWTKEPGELQSMESQRVGPDWATLFMSYATRKDQICTAYWGNRQGFGAVLTSLGTLGSGPCPGLWGWMWSTPKTLYGTQKGRSMLIALRSDQISRVRLFATPWIAAHQASLSCYILKWFLKVD